MPENLKRINKNVTTLKRNPIPISVALSEGIEDYQKFKVLLSFEYYNQGQCEIAKLQSRDTKKLTNELKKVSKTFLKHFKNQNFSRIACKPVHCSGNYVHLFDRLSKDQELLEINYTKNGRIFGYLLRNVFNVVAVKVKHLK